MTQLHPRPTASWLFDSSTKPTLTVTETILRDGAQAMPAPALAYLTVDRKLAIIGELAEAGIPDIEVASFAHPKVLPQFADADELVSRLPRDCPATFRGVTPNLRGLTRAAAAGAAGLVTMIGMIACSEEYQRRNVGKSVAEGLDGLAKMIAFSQAEGIRLIAGAGVAFECPYAGPVAAEQVLTIVASLSEIGFDEIWIGDTFGMANALEIHHLMAELASRFPATTFGLHLHNRHGLALANFLAALDAGIVRFDTSLLGIGAGSVIPGNRTEMGNVATEEIVHLAESLGIPTGVDLERLRELGLALSTSTDLPARSRVLNTGVTLPTKVAALIS